MGPGRGDSPPDPAAGVRGDLVVSSHPDPRGATGRRSGAARAPRGRDPSGRPPLPDWPSPRPAAAASGWPARLSGLPPLPRGPNDLSEPPAPGPSARPPAPRRHDAPKTPGRVADRVFVLTRLPPPSATGRPDLSPGARAAG